MTKYITDGVLKHGVKIGHATVISNRLEGKGYAVPGYKLSPKYITIHNTGDDNVKGINWYNALHNANVEGWRKASWHITVDCDKIYQSVNLLRVAWHAGDGEYGIGNRNSIGIEHVQYNNDKEKQKMVWENSIELVKILMNELDIPFNNIVQHYYWTRKDCPYLLRHARFGYDWTWYKNQIVEPEKQLYVRINYDGLNARNKADWDADPIIKLEKGCVLTVINTVEAKNGKTKMYETKSGIYVTTSKKYVEVFEK